MENLGAGGGSILARDYQWQRQVPIVVRPLGESLLNIKEEENMVNALVVLEYLEDIGLEYKGG